MIGVDLNATDYSRMTETKHGPLPARNLQDAPLIHLQGNIPHLSESVDIKTASRGKVRKVESFENNLIVRRRN